MTDVAIVTKADREAACMLLTARQRGLLIDMEQDGAVQALLFSRFSSEGPNLRAMGLIGGRGDASGITDAGRAALGQSLPEDMS